VFKKSGEISHFVLSRGGVLGLNQTKILIPWSVITLQQDEARPTIEGLLVDISEGELATAPALGINDLSQIANPTLKAKLEKYLIIEGNQSTAASSVTREKIMSDFNNFDADNNGFLSEMEVKENKQLSSNFAGADNNADGKLSKGEFSKYMVNE
jgi:hypothetical protein